MRDYESIFILSPNLDEAESEKLCQRMQEVIASNGGEVVKVDKWGKRKLAYVIKKHRKGEYVLIQFRGGPATVAELERNYKMTDNIIKFLTVRVEKDMLLAQQAQAQLERQETPAPAAGGETGVSAETEAPASAEAGSQAAEE